MAGDVLPPALALDEKAAPAAGGTLAYHDEDLFRIFGIETTSINVGPRSALELTAVSAAVRLLSETAGGLKFHVYKRGDGEAREIDREHPAEALLNEDANDWTAAGDLRALLVSDALLHGNGYAFANRVEGRVVELLRLDPRAVSIVVDQLTGEPSFEVSVVTGGRRVYGVRDIIHLRGPHLDVDGVSGLAAIKVAANAIRFGLALQRHGVNLFERGARPGGVLMTPAGTRIDAETRARMKASWRAYEGSANAGGTPLLEQGTAYQPFTFNSTDAQFLELLRFIVDDISRAFGVPAHMLGEMGRATWANVGELGREFLAYGLSPWLTRLEAGYRRVLLSPDERAERFIEAETDGLISADIKSRAEAYSLMRAAGVVTGNECRARENLPARPDGDSLSNPNTTSGAEPEGRKVPPPSEPAEQEPADGE
ncbi:phage portal protein [Methylopila jiangsuensis]|nr:phage portal protein [Methylopila jiangsuensis]